MHRSAAALIALAAFLAACSSAPKPAAAPAPEAAAAAPAAAGAPAPAAAAPTTFSLAGEWEVEIATAQQGVVASMMRLVDRGGAYIGILQPLLSANGESIVPGAGPSPFQVRSATVTGNQVVINLDFEGDNARITGSFRGANRIDGAISARAVAGRVTMRRR